MSHRNNNETLCWRCKNAIGNCPWSSRGEVIEGWEAEEIQIVEGKKPILDSFKVKKCPVFEPEKFTDFEDVRDFLVNHYSVKKIQITRRNLTRWVEKYEIENPPFQFPKWVHFLQEDYAKKLTGNTTKGRFV